MMHGRWSWAAALALATALAGCGSKVGTSPTGATGGGSTTGSTTTSGSTGGGSTTGGGGAAPFGVLVMLPDQPITLAVIGGDVYVGLFLSGIFSIPKATGLLTPRVPLANGYSPGVYLQNAFVFDQKSLYFAESSGGDTSGPIVSGPLGGGLPAVLTSSTGFTSGVAVDANAVYWVDQDQGTVSSVPLGGGTATTLATGLATPGGLVEHAGTLYLTDAAGDLLSVPTGGGTATTLFTGPGVPANTEVADYSPAVVADDANVYFVVCDWNGGGETIYRQPLAGNAGPQVLVTASVGQCATELAVDGAELYYAEGSTIMAVPIAGGTPRLVVTSPQPVVAGPAIDAENVYWGVTPDTATCGLCPPPPMGQINAVLRAPKSGP